MRSARLLPLCSAAIADKKCLAIVYLFCEIKTSFYTQLSRTLNQGDIFVFFRQILNYVEVALNYFSSL